MRRTCARVLAAALMAGSIFGVVAMSAFFGAPTDIGRPLASPPSSLQRSVPVVAQPLQRPTLSAVTARRVAAPARPVVTRTLVVAQVARPVPRHLTDAKPKPVTPAPTAPSPAPAQPVQLAQVQAAGAQTPVDPAPAQSSHDQGNSDEGNGNGNGNGNGHAYGHDKHDD